MELYLTMEISILYSVFTTFNSLTPLINHKYLVNNFNRSNNLVGC